MLLNIVIILGVLLIAYWWGNQGLFSSLLHLICVVVSGAIAFGLWEPLTYALLRGNKMDAYWWGVCLIGLFTVTLFILRLAIDRIVPANVRFSGGVNLGGGIALGAISGILTMGIFTLGVGLVQTKMPLGGVTEWSRSTRTGQVSPPDSGKIWFPVHSITARFYELVSNGSMRPIGGTSLATYYPELDQYSMSLVRDTYKNGQAQISIEPDAVTVKRVIVDTSNRFGVEVSFESAARDFAEQLVISQSQVRLLCRPRGGKATTIYPDQWSQERDGRYRVYLFDSTSHYLTSQPGQQTASAIIQFQVPLDEEPRFIQIKGSRFRLPTPEEGNIIGAEVSAAATGGGGTGGGGGIALGGDITSVVRVTNSVRPIIVSSNRLGAMSEVDNYMTEGELTYRGTGSNVSNRLRIKGVYEPSGTRCVQIDVSRKGVADIFAKNVRDQAEDNAEVYIRDNLGSVYYPIGFMHKRSDQSTFITLQPGSLYKTLDQLPSLPSSGAEELKLIFHVTIGRTINELRYGSVVVGRMNTEIEVNRRG